MPNAICEGMMLGKPIIMIRVTEYTKLVDETNGFLCDWNNPASIKKAFIAALNIASKELEIMGKNSKYKAQKLFPENVIVQKWTNLINIEIK